MKSLKQILIEKINQSEWWHVPPTDPDAYKKRGKFLAATFSNADFYGRPLDNPEKVHVKNPLFGFSEIEILGKLFGKKRGETLSRMVGSDDDDVWKKDWYEKRIGLDAKMHNRAKELKYDSIVLMTKAGKSFLRKGIKPKSIELNLINSVDFSSENESAMNLC